MMTGTASGQIDWQHVPCSVFKLLNKEAQCMMARCVLCFYVGFWWVFL